MVGCFGLCDDHHHTRVPHDLIVEANPRLDVWMLLQCGGLAENATTRLQWGEKECLAARRTPDIWIDGTRVPVTWDEPMPGVGRPWFECPACGRRCRHVYLRETIACRRCHGLRSALHALGGHRAASAGPWRVFPPMASLAPGQQTALIPRLLLQNLTFAHLIVDVVISDITLVRISGAE